MARIESTALGGFYPTPTTITPLIASCIRRDRHANEQAQFDVLDPCAGEGVAAVEIFKRLGRGTLYAVELEKSRHATLENNTGEVSSRFYAKHGDAFRLEWTGDGASCVYLNPPYDHDRRYGRLEERWLVRFTGAVRPAGLLIFVIPFYAIEASAKTLATEYEEIEVFRFPKSEFASYKQVVVFAKRRVGALLDPDAATVTKLLDQAKDHKLIPELATHATLREVPAQLSWQQAFHTFQIAKLDFVELLETYKPWHQTNRRGELVRIVSVLPETAIADYMVRDYPIAMPPRSAHIAAGLAAGIFNGERIEPDDPASGLPPLLVKGVFDREYRTVEEKTDRDGDVVGEVQVQQPKLVTTVLDLSKSRYTTIIPSGEKTGATTIGKMTMADLLDAYGRGLMRVMLKHCPVLHDPQRTADHFELGEVARPLFSAQHHATQAAVKLLGGPKAGKKSRRFKGCFVLGEIGSGKTSLALAVNQTIGSKFTLVMCPPHLLDSWKEQIEAVTPWVKCVVLEDLGDVDELIERKRAGETGIVAVLSRETAKLGHSIAGLSGVCPSCGETIDPSIDHAKRRSRCEGRRLVFKHRSGQLMAELASLLIGVCPDNAWVHQLCRSRTLARMLDKERCIKEDLRSARRKLAWRVLRHSGRLGRIAVSLARCGHGYAASLVAAAELDEKAMVETAKAIFKKTDKLSSYAEPCRSALTLLLLISSPMVHDAVRTIEARFFDDPECERVFRAWRQRWDNLHAGKSEAWCYDFADVSIDREKNKARFYTKEPGGWELVISAIEQLRSRAVLSKECGEPLFQAEPRPRRYPLATYIARRCPWLFDLLVLDEGQEYASDGSAQERSAHRLTSLGIPTLLMSGTIMNGYAESLFTNMWALSPKFRSEFTRDDRSRFVDRYGYRKRIVEDREKDTGKVVEFGAVTDRVERSERVIGKAPGLLPLFIFQHLLPISVTLHKVDLSTDIPNCTEEVVKIDPTPELLKEYKRIESELVQRIKRDRFEPGLAGKLWGAMADFPSFLDLATRDTGNTDGGDYVVAYPEACGGSVVARSQSLPPSVILPKEQWMLDKTKQILSEGRNAMIFAWHQRLLPRLARLLEAELGEPCPILDPAKVPTGKRQAWINKEIVKQKRRVMVCNPVTIQTGLNNLVYFSDELWMENPACNPIVYRQAVGRVDRIGQREPTRIWFSIYTGTAQEKLHQLLLHKVAVSMSTDGLDADSALSAAGIGEDDGLSSFAVGRQLYEMIAQQVA